MASVDHTVLAEVLQSYAGSYKELAEEAGVSYDSLMRWLRGDRSPRPESLNRIAAAVERKGHALLTNAARLRSADPPPSPSPAPPDTPDRAFSKERQTRRGR